jgi:hypothetical protein
VKVRYLHSDIDTLERVEILRDLRRGEFDVLVGINLLREGLDLPEVSLVAILDADKEGFLRSPRSLIQTIGRAARNVEGRVIMYADRNDHRPPPRDAERHRARPTVAGRSSEAYNEAAEHGITPADQPVKTRFQKAIVTDVEVPSPGWSNPRADGSPVRPLPRDPALHPRRRPRLERLAPPVERRPQRRLRHHQRPDGRARHGLLRRGRHPLLLRPRAALRDRRPVLLLGDGPHLAQPLLHARGDVLRHHAQHPAPGRHRPERP